MTLTTFINDNVIKSLLLMYTMSLNPIINLRKSMTVRPPESHEIS